MSLVVPTDLFTIQVTMTSDWHVGSGLGRGEIDSLVQRDADNLPYLPAKTLTGILRDGCEQVALALDNGNERGRWHDWINFLFGDQPALAQGAIEPEPRPAVLSIRSACLESDLHEALKVNKHLTSAISFIKPGVAIDGKTGSAKPDYLRFEEVVRMGAVLTAESNLDFSDYRDLPDDNQKVAYALLIAGAKMVERLGGKRRRGNGTCEITIIDAEGGGQKGIQWLKENCQDITAPPSWKPQALSSSALQNPDTDPTWYTVSLTMTTQSPVVLPKRTVGNVVESLDYIPGRYFLRYLHQKLGDQFNVSQAIARGDLVITNATIEIAGKAGRPTPFCLFGEKLGGGLSERQGVYNRFHEPEPEDIQLKGERKGYIGNFDGSHLPEYKTVSLELFTHNTIRDDVQRPMTDVGGVYSYQAIPAGVTLMAELRFPKSIQEHLVKQQQDWWKSLKGKLRIGQSKKDQYGVVKLTPSAPQLVESTTNENKAELSKLYVWFLSDVLLRDERLNPTTHPDDFKRALEPALDLMKNTLQEWKTDERTQQDLLSLMMRSRRTESWQVRWGLPRPSMLGWQAGSCIVYETNEEIKPEKLAELAAKGIGDRRAEGYGQLCFNDPLLMKQLSNLKLKELNSEAGSSVPTPAIPPDDSSFNYARTIEKAAWRTAITNQALIIAADAQKREAILGIKITQGNGKEADKQPKSQPPMSQLGGLRSVFLKLQLDVDAAKVTSWIDALESVANRKEKWQKTEDGLNKIRSLVDDPQIVWSCLKPDLDGSTVSPLNLDELVITANGVEELKSELWAEAVRTLVDAIIRAQKRALEDAENQVENQTQDGEAA
ncbi:MAG: RAMP superfamily CRISPR-associated protein [Leptolyngbyaceae cyanobacterium]